MKDGPLDEPRNACDKYLAYLRRYHPDEYDPDMELVLSDPNHEIQHQCMIDLGHRQYEDDQTHPQRGREFRRAWRRGSLARRKDRKAVCHRIDLRVAPGAERWAPSPAVMRKLACMVSAPIIVELWPRQDLPRVWARDHGGRSVPVPPYTFRAYSRDNRARLFVDPTETPESILWLMLHELAHIELPHSRLVSRAYRALPRPEGYLTTDEGHEAHAEEQLANLVATQTMRELGHRGPALDRLWWRRRVDRMRGGQ